MNTQPASTPPVNSGRADSPAGALPYAARLTALQDNVAGFALLRMATVPYRMLDALRLPATEKLIQAIFEAEADMETQRQLLEDALFAAVAALDKDDKATRRRVLQLRREVHAGSSTGLPAMQLDDIQARLLQPEQAALASWRDAQGRLKQAGSDAELSFTDEMQSVVRPALRAPIKNRLFHSALALASAGVALGAEREQHLPRKPDPDNFERSMFGYLVRAAGKTSPFSSFMATSVVSVDLQNWSELPLVEDQDMHRRVSLNRGMIARLARLIIRTAAKNGDLPLHINPTLHSIGDNRYRALCERDIILLGRPWREQRRTQFSLHADVCAVLDGPLRSANWADWRAAFVAQGVKEAQVDGLLDKLYERGVLKTPLLSDAFDPRPAQALLNFLKDTRHEQLQQARTLIEKMDQLRQQLVADESSGRVGSVEQIRATEQQIIQAVGGGQQEAFQNMALEDCWTDGVKGHLGGNLLAPLADMHDFLSTQVGISPHYARLLKYFVDEYGTGGQCDNLTGFLIKYGDKLIDAPEYGNTYREDSMKRAPVGSLMGVTAQVDIAFSQEDQRPLMIVNKVYDRAGWLSSRFALGEESGQTYLTQAMRTWVRRIAGQCEPVDLLVNGDCNDLQAHPRLTRRVLQWHGEPVIGEQSETITPDQLRLQHNPASGMLELFDDQGQPVSLVYLGSTVPTPTWGIPFALSILTQPCSLLRPGFAPPVAPGDDEIIFKPRQQLGQLVLSRAVWWVRSSYLLREWFAGQGAARLLKVRRECERHGLPRVMYAQAFPVSAVPTAIPNDILNSDRKPMWIDTRAPFCLSMLSRIAQRNDWIALSEMLPAPEDHWLQVNGERHVCELQLEMLIASSDAPSPF